MEEFISKGYLYTEWKGKLTVKEGTVVRDDHCYAEEAKFRYGHRSREWVRCHIFPKHFVGSKFWLPERDDELGKRILIEYHEDQIDRFTRLAASHEEKIYKLRNA